MAKRKCDMPKEIEASGWKCDKCYEEYANGAEADSRVCVKCRNWHLRKNMMRKLEGHYCEACGADYERELYEKHVGEEAKQEPEL